MAPATSVQVILELERGEDELDLRIFNIKQGSPIQVGRSSKTERKHLTPAQDNCWIKNPVISRSHAVISLGLSDERKLPTVYIEDNASSHGTFLNGVNIQSKGKHVLRGGDKIQFGDKVLRADEEFDPPVFGVGISHNHENYPISSSPSVRGATYGLSDEFSDEDDYPDSASEADYDEKSSAPGSSINNPVTIDDEVPAPGPVIVDLATGEVVGMASREQSEDYEPSLNIVAVQDTYAEAQKEDDQLNQGDEFDEDGNAQPMHINPPIYTAQSPVYTPTSPKWESGRPMDYIPMQEPILPDLSMSYMPQAPIFTYTGSSIYVDGPFAQPPSAHAAARPSSAGPDSFDSVVTGQSDPYAQEVSDQLSFRIQVKENLSNAAPEHPEEAKSSSLTVTTHELLDTTRMPAPKNDMAIENIINPPQASSTARLGNKRKAEEISEDLFVLPPITDACSISGAALPAEQQQQASEQIVIENAAEPPAQTQAIAEERPRKRLFRDFRAFALGSALGGIGVLAGLVALPDSIFQ